MVRISQLLNGKFPHTVGKQVVRSLRCSVYGMFLCGGMLAAENSFAQDILEPPKVRRAPAGTIEAKLPSEQSEAQQRADKFAEYMTGASLKGRFSITGRGDKMPEETYTISKCEKLPEENIYRFTARIQYGDTDTELPMDIPVEWAGDTPVISLTNMWLPGLGTFSARVMIYKDTYAGTWIHDEVGGQMFGVIVKDAKEAESPEQAKPEQEAPGSEIKPKPQPTSIGK